MNLHLISPPEQFAEEWRVLSSIFANGLDYFHLRKPRFDLLHMKSYVESIDADYHSRIILHSHWELITEFDLGGIHIPERFRNTSAEKDTIQMIGLQKSTSTIGTSFHDLESLALYLESRASPYDYCFISPVFDSISKPNYSSHFHEVDLARVLKNAPRKVVALGGIAGENVESASSMGFGGIAALGAVWNDSNPVAAFRKLKNAVDVITRATDTGTRDDS